MSSHPSILVVAATARELAVSDEWISVRCGVGPVEAAAVTAAAIAEHAPDMVLHVGIAGARRSLGLSPATLIIGSEAHYSDLELDMQLAPHVVVPPPELVVAAQRAVPHARVMPIGTSAHVGGTAECDVEAMEGFGVLRAAQLAGIPAIEVRAISNVIEELDRTHWHFDVAFDAIVSCTPALVAALRQLHVPMH